ncbi:ketopantoate reductase family protein [Streptacidiphilus jiangxiensis]|uniref:2-dehydropantoate 2-reductase n=1 Tax=Streptacidiphilus jiangxiensis TaxID=235985 RepID=A0A1H7UBF1_STRJI|nr:2-dehydropantoate 2-reductase N-terminal domain-containing protein [Streptacidiphilus jiangxiensis]SEL94139.1 2-dehydropantoate 2-reductase [Streptacidiphilus jiangxiensis]
MRYVIVGAGAVGGAIGGRLAQSGREVALVARGAHLDALRTDGLSLVTPQGTERLRIPAYAHHEDLGPLRRDDVLILAVKSQDTEAVLRDWSAAAVAGGGTAGEVLPVVCAQNGVANEGTALRWFAEVVGMCVWLPATHLQPGTVVAHCAPLSGILTLGGFTSTADGVTGQLAEDLDASRFHAPVVPDVMRWKYGKLLNNLGNALEALVGRDGMPDAADLWQRTRGEGVAVLDAAGIPYSTEEERQAVQGDRMGVVPMPDVVRAGGSTWQSLTRGGGVEVDFLNGEIAMLGRLHGVPTPTNDLLRREVARLAAEGLPPGSTDAAELRSLLAEAEPNL